MTRSNETFFDHPRGVGCITVESDSLLCIEGPGLFGTWCGGYQKEILGMDEW